MFDRKAGAAALALGSTVWILIMFVHPTHAGGQPILGRFTLSDLVHGAALLAKPLMLYGFWCFTGLVEGRRPLAMLAFCYFLFAAILTAVAGTISGWITSEAAAAAHAATGLDRDILAGSARLSMWFNRGFADVHVTLASFAYVLWAIAWRDRSPMGRVLRLWGFCTGAGVLVWQFSGTFEPNAHLMPYLVLAQASWAIAVASWMWRACREGGTSEA